MAGPATARERGGFVQTQVDLIQSGKVAKRVTNTKNATLIALRVNPAKFRVGVHRLVANVTFQAGSLYRIDGPSLTALGEAG